VFSAPQDLCDNQICYFLCYVANKLLTNTFKIIRVTKYPSKHVHTLYKIHIAHILHSLILLPINNISDLSNCDNLTEIKVWISLHLYTYTGSLFHLRSIACHFLSVYISCTNKTTLCSHYRKGCYMSLVVKSHHAGTNCKMGVCLCDKCAV
jgi:hypothetical protein